MVGFFVCPDDHVTIILCADSPCPRLVCFPTSHLCWGDGAGSSRSVLMRKARPRLSDPSLFPQGVSELEH